MRAVFTHVLGLEQLGDREEDISSLVLCEFLSLVEKVQQLRQKLATLAWVERCVVEYALLKQHCALFQAHKGCEVWW